MTIHFSTFAPDKYGPQILEWGGGYFDWQGDDGKRSWYSAIKTLTAEVKPGQPNHPIANGVAPFQIEEEFYYRIRFRENDPRLDTHPSCSRFGERPAGPGGRVGCAAPGWGPGIRDDHGSFLSQLEKR